VAIKCSIPYLLPAAKKGYRIIPWMMPNTLHKFRPLMKFCIDRHFIYITVCADENKEELQSYYKFTKEELEEITKEWPTEFLIPVTKEELSDPNLIGSSIVTHEEYNTPNNSRRKKKEDVQELRRS
jgi:hypothetical protein